jgi:hypothetical protein
MVMPVVAAAVAARTLLLRWLLFLPVVVTLVAFLGTAVSVAASLLFRLGLVGAVVAVLVASGVTTAMPVLFGIVVMVIVAG